MKPEGITIRRATTFDAHDVEDLYGLLYTDDPIHTKEVRTDEVARAIDQGTAWVAAIGGKAVGYVMGEFFDEHQRYFPNSIFLSGLYVVEPYRKQGIARRLIEGVLNADHPSKYSSFSITHDPEEEWLSEYYASFGFKEIGKTDEGNVMMVKHR